MIKMNKVAQESIYVDAPFWSQINLTGAYVKLVKWEGNQGYMVVIKNRCPYKIGLFPNLYAGKGNLKKKSEKKLHKTVRKITAKLSRVGSKNFEIGYIYNLKNLA